MVSSRWVSWLSTGTREVSASVARKRAAAARIDEASIAPPPLKAEAKTARRMIGSRKPAKNISREEPNPPKGLAGSSPARAKKNRPSDKTKVRRIRSPARIKTAADNTDPRTIYGVTFINQEECSEKRSSFLNNLARLKYGWNIPGPRRSRRLVFILEITPLISGAAASINNILMISPYSTSVKTSPQKTTRPKPRSKYTPNRSGYSPPGTVSSPWPSKTARQ